MGSSAIDVSEVSNTKSYFFENPTFYSLASDQVTCTIPQNETKNTFFQYWTHSEEIGVYLLV